MDPLEFLSRHAPFESVTPSGRERLAAALEITWTPGGQRVFERGQAQEYLYTVRKGQVRLELDGQRVTDLGPGEIFGLTSLAAGEEPMRLDATATTDCLLYRFHHTVVQDLCSSEPAFASFFLSSLSHRLRDLADSQALVITSDLGRTVGELVRRPPVTRCLSTDGAEITVGEAAATMQEAGVSSVLLVEPEASLPVGIVTDRDLRGKVLARGLGASTPVSEVMTSPVETLDAKVSGAEALLQLLRRDRHHLVLESGGELVGVVSHSDLLRHHLQSPAAVLDQIRAANDPRDLAGHSLHIARTVETLLGSGLAATEIGRVVAALNDALSSRLLELAERSLAEERGAPPCPYAWIVFGSEGRQEQSFLTDQDNALVFAEDSEDTRAYFEALARQMVNGLLEAGFPPCPGGFMATRWCLPLEEWAHEFHRWITQPEPENLLRVANFFDWRQVYGGLDLGRLEAIVAAAKEHDIFLAQLTRASMHQRPPLGLLHRIVEEEGGVDLKSGALMPVSGLARLFALEAGERAGSTLLRLRRAARAGTVSPEGADLLAGAFRFAFGLRLRRQIESRRRQQPITHLVTLDELTATERRHLKESFLAIDRMQKATAQRLETGLLG